MEHQSCGMLCRSLFLFWMYKSSKIIGSGKVHRFCFSATLHLPKVLYCCMRTVIWLPCLDSLLLISAGRFPMMAHIVWSKHRLLFNGKCSNTEENGDRSFYVRLWARQVQADTWQNQNRMLWFSSANQNVFIHNNANLKYSALFCFHDWKYLW